MDELIALAVLGGAALFAAGVLAYVAGSFIVMRAHTERRPLGRQLREALREGAWAVLIQPLLPLYYLVGRRMGGRPGGVPVVFVHGYTQNRVNFLALARELRRAGAGPLYGFNYPWFAPVEANAARLDRFIGDVLAETGAAEVDLVCHSLGGLVALEYLVCARAPRVRRIVTIASPHAGVAWKGPIVGACGQQLRAGCAFLRDRAGAPIQVPCLSIYSTHDNIVHPATTSALGHRGGRDVLVPDLGHLSILFAPQVIAEVRRYLT